MQIAITALGKNHPDHIKEIALAITGCQCNIVETRMTVMAGEMAALLLVDGNWNHVAKLENTLDCLEKRFGLRFNYQRTEANKNHPARLPYAIDAIGVDRHGIIQDLTGFLSERNILIQDLSASCQAAAYTETPMFSVHIVIAIPANLHLISLRDEFLEFCDQLNIDAILEPVKR